MSRNSNLVLQTHTFLIVVLQKVYRILPARECRLHGPTTASDSESDFHNWFFKPHAYGRKNFKRLLQWRTGWWTVLLILLCSTFWPAELYVEMGVYSRQDCSPIEKNSSGICAG